MPTRFSFLGKVRAALIVVGLVLLGATASAQQDSGALQQRKASSLQQRKTGSLLQRKANLEIQKLELEAKKLDRWGPAIFGVIGAVIGGLFTGGLAAWVTHRVAREKQAADLDQATHEKRLESYQGLLKHTSPFAIHFPEWPSPWHPWRPLDRHKCEQIGQAISKWYFESGLLLSAEARDAYFRLARALTRASSVDDLCVPKSPDDVKKITQKSVEDYRKRFNIEQPNDDRVETWPFGKPSVVMPSRAYEFKDYVFLQTLSSRLRTRLTEDIRSRRLPGQWTPSAGPRRWFETPRRWFETPRRWFACFRRPLITSLSPASPLWLRSPSTEPTSRRARSSPSTACRSPPCSSAQPNSRSLPCRGRRPWARCPSSSSKKLPPPQPIGDSHDPCRPHPNRNAAEATGERLEEIRLTAIMERVLKPWGRSPKSPRVAGRQPWPPVRYFR
jgi:hypothetical protein